MKKSANVDIRNLFRRFDGDTGSYQEIQQGYVVDKAEQSWPIVKAMEQERAGAPMLKANASRSPESATGSFAAAVSSRSAGSATGVFAAITAAQAEPVARRAAPHDPQAAGLQAGGLQGVFSRPATPSAPAHSLFGTPSSSSQPAAAPIQPAAAPSSSVQSLFGALNGAVRTEPEPASPVRSLFGSLSAAARPAELRSEPVQPVQVQRSVNDPLNSVFSRLLGQQIPGSASLPENGLRGMLGFLKK
jgi:hypothetical protein